MPVDRSGRSHVLSQGDVAFVGPIKVHARSEEEVQDEIERLRDVIDVKIVHESADVPIDRSVSWRLLVRLNGLRVEESAFAT